MMSSPRSSQLEKARMQQWRSNAAKNKNKLKINKRLNSFKTIINLCFGAHMYKDVIVQHRQLKEVGECYNV